MLNRTLAPEFETLAKINLIQAKEIKLENGIPLYFINAGSQELNKIEVLFYAGSKYQSKPLLASFANKLCIEGTSTKSSQQISEEMDFLGSYLENECNTDWASLKVYSLNKHLNSSLEILCDIISNASFPEEEFDIQLQNSHQNFLTRNKRVNDIAAAEFQQILFGESNFYGKKTIESDYSNITNDEIKKFYQQNYSIENMVVIASGKIEQKQIDEINNTLGKISKSGTKNKSLNLDFNNPLENKFIIEKEDSVQSAIRIGKRLFNKTHSDFIPLQVLNTVFGGYFGSRLMKNIREDKGYTYGIGSGLVSKPEGGYWVISSEVGSDVCKNALEEIYKEITLLNTQLIPDEELALVKNYMLGQFLKSADGAFSLSDKFIGLMVYGLDYSYYDNYVSTINRITSEDLLKLSQKHFNPEGLLELVVGKKLQ